MTTKTQSGIKGVDWDYLNGWIVWYEDGTWSPMSEVDDPYYDKLLTVLKGKGQPLDSADAATIFEAALAEVDAGVAESTGEVTPETNARSQSLNDPPQFWTDPATGKQYRKDSPTAQWEEVKPVAQNTPLPPGQDRTISEGGYDFAYDPATGDYTDLIGKTPAEVKRTTDQQIEDYMAAGNWDAAMNLQTMKDWVQSPKGLTPDQIAGYALNLGVAPDEWRSWYEALTQDYNTAQGKPTPPKETFGLTPEQQASLGPQQMADAQKMKDLGLEGFIRQQNAGTPAFAATPPTPQGTEEFFAGLAKMLGVPPPVFGTQTTSPTTPTTSAFVPPGGGYQGPATGQGKALVAPPGPFGLTAQQQASLGQGQMSEAQRMQSLGLEEYIKQQNQEQAVKARMEQLGKEAGIANPTGTLTPEQVTAINAGGGQVPTLPTAEGITPEQLADMPEPFDEIEAAKKAAGQPYSVKDRYTGGRGYVFKPTPSYQTRAAYAAAMPQGTSPFTAQTTPQPAFQAMGVKPTPLPRSPTTSPGFQAQQTAAWKSGNQAGFEQGLFGTPKPLSAEDALQQAWYRKWQKQQQSAFQARPVRRTVFR